MRNRKPSRFLRTIRYTMRGMERWSGWEMECDADGDYVDRNEALSILRTIRDEASRALQDAAAQYEAADSIGQLRGGLERIVGMVSLELQK